VGGALAPIFGAKAPPTINKTMTYTSLKYDVSYFQEYFHSLSRLGTLKKFFQLKPAKVIVVTRTG